MVLLACVMASSRIRLWGLEDAATARVEASGEIAQGCERWDMDVRPVGCQLFPGQGMGLGMSALFSGVLRQDGISLIPLFFGAFSWDFVL